MQNRIQRPASFGPLLNFSPLHDAFNVIWPALLHLTPFRALTPADIVDAEPGFTVWEEGSDAISVLAYDHPGNPGVRPNTNLLLADAILRFCEYGAGIPDIDGTDQTAALRQRFVALKRHIEHALLAEVRANEREKRQGRNDTQCDLDLVRSWAVEIRKELLDPGQRTEHWTHDILPWLLGYLTTWDDIDFSILAESGITTAMKDIIYAPGIPVVSYLQSIRTWAASLLNRWKSHPDAQTLDPSEKTRLGLDVELPADTPPPSTDTQSTPKILYRTAELARDFQEFEDALIAETADDHSRTFRALDKIEAWKTEAEPLTAQCIRDSLYSLLRGQYTPSRPLPVAEVEQRVQNIIKKFSSGDHLQRRVTSLSYYTPLENEPEPSIRLTFRDKNSLPDANRQMSSFGNDTPDERTWEDVVIETNTMGPMNVLLSQFISIANPQHRHPLAPLTNFSFASTPDPFYSYRGKTGEEVQELRNRLWEVSTGRFIQGRVRDLPITEGNLVYYNRGHFSRTAVQDLTMKQPRERTLPPSCVTPAHWIRPSKPPGREDIWECLPSLFFVGSGHDLYPGATSPPAIASHVYVPRSFERLGIYPHAAYREEVAKDSTPVKWEPPLTSEQALALLGRAIQYEVPVVPQPPLPPNARPKKKRREAPPPVHWGVVWGVDPEALVLRVFTGGQYQETSIALTVGGPCEVPSTKVDTKLPFTPKWVGALTLVDDAAEEIPTPSVPEAPTVDRLASILEIKSPQFEVGIDGNCVILVGEIAIHGIESYAVEKLENCKPGIWQGGRSTEENKFAIWVRWLRESSIDLSQPLESFVTELEDDTIVGTFTWTRVATVSVDGGTMTTLAEGMTSFDSIFALTGDDDGDVDGLSRYTALHGAEEDSFHIPGGVSSYTGGDGGFDVYTASDSDGKVVAVKVTE
ncbi:hypothetical protein B0H16DRAFT_1509527 [Mycena metata]|uniref:Uncharacterized protein n=1 Tax=Mycena metata TaxID=1033252 RepID=A0AAD7JZL9_9AGAR|nr:hypothetical protein B0H16DRAFT_1509527 [Mycena metata]